ncbi:hypothetical protein Nepgr_032011 [Nepenthes gracilis]|uniref:Glutaredoxin-dependent peroxiredoxin n=1 Tax=Nepenthes gracilis TaxID=150966 RepID=A0AAD3THT2_NEPGR|nr:hypothetical protein Nepgr_032011 [Nepenthes gracilis]
MAFAASLCMSKLLSLSSSATAGMAAVLPSKTLHSRLPFSSFTTYSRPLNFRPLRFSASSSTKTTPISASISVGTKLPDATLSYFDSTGELQTTTVSDLTASKKAILFAVPGAFTPTCSQKHLPGFVEKSNELKSKGVDVIACISVNDAFVMKAWKKDVDINDQVLLLSDGNGDFTRAIGAELDLRDKPTGLGVRSRRYSMLVEDGIVKKCLRMDAAKGVRIKGKKNKMSFLFKFRIRRSLEWRRNLFSLVVLIDWVIRGYGVCETGELMKGFSESSSVGGMSACYPWGLISL